MPDTKKNWDVATVIAIAALVGVIDTQLHEAVGHGGACLLLAREVREWGAFYLDCDTRTAPLWIGRMVAAGGTIVNLLTAMVGFAMWRATPAAAPRARLFWWLAGALGGMEALGYLFFSGVSGIGDWGASQDGVFHGVPGWSVWRIAIAVAGGLLYWRWAVFCVRRLAAMTGADEAGRRQARQIAAISYWTIGGSAFVIGLMNPVGVFILLASAVASSFGGPSALLWAPYYIRPGAAAAQPMVIARSWLWIAAGLAAILAEGVILGPSIRF